jgi:hypothetical protein
VGVLFARLTWMLLGPLALCLLCLSIVTIGRGWLTGADVAFFAVLLAMLLGRWLEFRSGQAETATGEPMTKSELLRYLILAPALALGVWVVANLLGNHWPGR